ncbi:MAG: DUF2505 domain-containing protein [Nocardioides sp.]
MKIRHEMTYDATPAEVYAMLSETAFRERVCAAMHATELEVSIEQAGDGMSVVVDQTQPADGIPSFATKFVGDHIRIVQSESWTSPEKADLSVEIPGKPGHLRGTITLVGNGSGTTETVEGDVKVSIPLVGGKLEKLIGEMLVAALRKEQKVGRAWLAGDR